MRRRSVFALLLFLGLAGVPRAAEVRPERPEGSGQPDVETARNEPARPSLTEPEVRREISHRKSDAAFWSLAAGVYLSAAGDWVTTRQFRAQGIEEANPLLSGIADSPAGLAGVKLGGGTLVNYLAYSLKKDGKGYWRAPQIAWIALNVLVSLHNSGAAD